MGSTCSVMNCYLPLYRSGNKVNLSCTAFLKHSARTTLVRRRRFNFKEFEFRRQVIQIHFAITPVLTHNLG